ncbi:scoloptoxin SSD14-like isoform X1 [Amphibalanus amphitrite]|uniref:scoloptoxin SSD14-like isoform X1 n=1 Tax=Amphibalanus amphitrite TaxID=1232801 RepID=UPI001C9284A3|nr:scoloptoxin SSD14-like isoform X1 [Amphibalanus amphitrite]
MPPSNPSKSERKHARKKRKLEERQNSYTQITDWNGDLPSITTEAPPKARITNRCMVKKGHVILLGLLLFLIITSIALSLAFCLPNLNGNGPAAFQELRPEPSSTPLRTFQKAAIASDATECAEIGAAILRRNGTAVDAAVAALVCVGVINTQSAGIGGGFIMTLYDRRQREAAALLARETAPAAATRDMFVDDPSQSQYGWKSAGVPGEVAGYWAAHQKHGRLPWAELFEPTIKLCREGYHVNGHQASYLRAKTDQLIVDPTFKSIFFNETTGEPKKEGDIVRRPALADTLQAIADGGAAALYGGQVGKQLADDIQKNGGIITLKDLEDYRVRWVTPATARLSDGLSLYGVPAPGSGNLLTFVFNILDGYQYSQHRPRTEEQLNLMYHRIAEAFKYAFARRTELADPEFVDISELMANLTSRDYAEYIRGLIDDSRTFNDPDHYGVDVAPVSDSGTAHVSVIDAEGNAVSVTSTVNLHFGAKVISPSTGILLNDEMDDFSTPGMKNYFNLPPSPSNFIKPGKMMVSSMSPSLFVDPSGDIRLVVGGAGGSRITTATALVAFRHLYLDEDVKTANDFPRFHHQLFPMTLNYDEGFPPTTVAYLSEKGHNMEQWKLRAVVPVLSRLNGVITGNMDYRKGAGDLLGF